MIGARRCIRCHGPDVMIQPLFKKTWTHIISYLHCGSIHMGVFENWKYSARNSCSRCSSSCSPITCFSMVYHAPPVPYRHSCQASGLGVRAAWALHPFGRLCFPFGASLESRLRRGCRPGRRLHCCNAAAGGTGSVGLRSAAGGWGEIPLGRPEGEWGDQNLWMSWLVFSFWRVL